MSFGTPRLASHEHYQRQGVSVLVGSEIKGSVVGILLGAALPVAQAVHDGITALLTYQ